MADAGCTESDKKRCGRCGTLITDETGAFGGDAPRGRYRTDQCLECRF